VIPQSIEVGAATDRLCPRADHARGIRADAGPRARRPPRRGLARRLRPAVAVG